MNEAAPLVLRADYPRVPDGTLIYAVGDIHGCAEQLAQMHAEILKDAKNVPAERRRVIYLGDYIDRGPDSKGVIEYLLKNPLPGFEATYLIGNHEAFLLEYLVDVEAGPGWFFNGGLATLASYGIKASEDDTASPQALAEIRRAFEARFPMPHRDFLTKLDFSATEGDYFFVHAGVRPGIALENQSDEDMLWIRDDFLSSEEDFGKVIVHGHTITWEPERRFNRIGIDTGCFASGLLTSLVLEGREQDFLTVQGAV